MRSAATTADAYLAELPADRRARLELVRELCRRYLPDHEEGIDWGMPVYVRAGRADFAWASQARHLALYVMRPEAVAACADLLAGLDMGKSCLRLKPAAEIDTGLVRSLLEATAACEPG